MLNPSLIFGAVIATITTDWPPFVAQAEGG
jgi:hypothetical protein